MKNIRLTFQFYRKNFLAMFLMISVTLYSIILLINALSQILYSTYTEELFSGYAVQDSLYYIPGTYEDTPDGLKEIRDGIAKLDIPGVTGIVQPTLGDSVIYNDLYCNVRLCDEIYRRVFPYFDEGNWLSESYAATSEIEAVVSGYLFQKVEVGDEITVVTNQYSNPPTVSKLKVVGKKNEPAYFPSFGFSSDTVTIQDLFEQGHNTICICDEDANRMYQTNSPGNSDVTRLGSRNLLIMLQNGLSRDEIKEIEKVLSNTGTVIDYAAIIENTDRTITQQLKEQLPRPLLMLFISTFSLVAISIMMINSKLSEYRIYFLCGCSKKRAFLQIFGAISFVPCLVCFVTVIYLYNIPNLYGSLNLLNPFQGVEQQVFGSEIVFAVILYFIIEVALSMIIAFTSLYKKTAIQIYRR